MNDKVVCDDTVWVTERNATVATGEGKRWIGFGAHLYRDCPRLKKKHLTGLLGKIVEARTVSQFYYGMNRLLVAHICKGCRTRKKASKDVNQAFVEMLDAGRDKSVPAKKSFILEGMKRPSMFARGEEETMAETEAVQIYWWLPEDKVWQSVSYAVVPTGEGNFYAEAAQHVRNMWDGLERHHRHLDKRSYRVIFGSGDDIEVAYLSLDPAPTITPELDPEEAG